GQFFERIDAPSVPGKIESKFAPHDQLFEKGLGRRLMFLLVLVNAQSDLQRRNVAWMQIRAQLRSRMGRGLVFIGVVTAQALVEKLIQPAKGSFPPAAVEARRSHRMVDLATAVFERGQI